jgi:hypothetical protein
MRWLPILVGVTGVVAACTPDPKIAPQHAERLTRVSGTEERAAEAQADIVVLEGIVIRKPWTKTGESWDTGGSHYYVLDIGDAVIEHRSAREGVILRPSENVPFDAFERFKGRRVTVEGRFVEGTPWTPPAGSVEQHPETVTDPVTGEVVPLRRGSGFQVFKITRLDEKAP